MSSLTSDNLAGNRTLYYYLIILQPTIWNDVFSMKICCFTFLSNWCHCWLGVASHCCLKSPDSSTLSWYVYIWWASIKGVHVFDRVMTLCVGCAARAHQLHSRKDLISAQIAAIGVSKSPPNCLSTFNNLSAQVHLVKRHVRGKMSGNWTDGAWMYFTDWLRHQLSASFLTCITVQRLEQIERAWLTVLSWRICSCFSLVEERERRTEGQVGRLALHGKRQLNPVTLLWSSRRGSSSPLGQRGGWDGVFHKQVPRAVLSGCLLRFCVTITPNVMCLAFAM